jgi:hypothetical protein
MMKRVISFALVGAGIALAGCPIYSDDHDHRVCIGDGCYNCPDAYYSKSGCIDWVCNGPGDCPSGYSCQSDHRCRLTDGTPPTGGTGALCSKPSDCPAGSNCGADNKCHTGDCSTSGCPSTYVCKLTGGAPRCVPVSGGGGTSSCKSDKDCPTPPGSKCLSGTCFAPQDQCADATQCPNGSQCVQGACTPSCSANKPCPTGYTCDPAKGVCTGSTTSCTSTTQCTGGTVCVQEHCVDPCGPGGTCAAGLVCIDGGCMPDQKPAFVCQGDGSGTGCLQGSTCLRHTCYISCDADAGADACKSADKFNVCKQVTTSTGTYSVCGSNDNLGTDCDPTQGKNCASPLVCIDGFCR